MSTGRPMSTNEPDRTDGEALLTRLRRIEGQVRGLQRMLEEGRVCEDILTQLMAARSSLDQVGLLIMDHHIEHCLLAGSSAEEGLRDLQSALRLWLRFGAPAPPQD